MNKTPTLFAGAPPFAAAAQTSQTAPAGPGRAGRGLILNNGATLSPDPAAPPNIGTNPPAGGDVAIVLPNSC